MQTQRRIQKGNFNVDYPSTNPLITNGVMEFMQSMEAFVSMADVPVIKVPSAQGQIAFLKQEYINRDEVQKRSSSMTEAEKGMLGVGVTPFTTDQRALEYILSAADAAQLGFEFGMDMPATIQRALAMKGAIHVEGLWAANLVSGSWNRTVTGNATDSGSEGTTAMNRIFWSDFTKDPIPGIRAEKRIFLLRAGVAPTNFRIGYKAFESLTSNPFVRAQVALTVAGANVAVAQTLIPTEAQISQLIGLKVSVSSGVKNTSMVDGTPSNSFIMDPLDALMTYDAPGEYTAQPANGGLTVNLPTSTGFARVAYEGVSPNGFQVRGPIDRQIIGAGGSKSWILDLYQGFVIIDKNMGTFFDNISQ